jgi:hypothetical protein
MLKSGAKMTRFDEACWRLDNSVLAASMASIKFERTCVDNIFPIQVSDRIARESAGHVASGTRARQISRIISRLSY